MATSQLRQVKVWLLVLCSIVALANGGTSRGGSIRSSYSSHSYSSSTSGSGASLTTGQIVGIVFGCIGAIIAIIAIPILVARFCLKKKTSDKPDQAVKDNQENNVADATYDHLENSTTTTSKLDPLKFPPPEATEYGHPGYDGYPVGLSTLSYPPPYTASTPVYYGGTNAEC